MYQGVMAAFAQGVQGVSFWAFHHAPQARWKPDYKERWLQIRRALRFAHEHRELMDYRVKNQVAIYFPHQDYYIKYFRAPWTKHGGVWGSGYFVERTYYTLVRAHIPTDIIFPPLGYEEQIRDDLKRYRVLVLPEASYLCDLEVEMLREWVEAGGLLLATGTIATHDQYGIPRESPALAEVTGVKYGPGKVRKYIRITAPGSLLPSFGEREAAGRPAKTKQVTKPSPLLPSLKPNALIRCSGWPVKEFLAIDGAKVTYEGAETHEKNMRTFRFRVDWLKEWKPEAPSLEPSEGCETIAIWEDKSPAVVVHPFGKGQVVSCAPVDLTIAYELVGRENIERRKFVSDICRSVVRPFETTCPPGLEVNVLQKDRKRAVTFTNQGYAPVDAFEFSMALDKKPKRVRFVSMEDDRKLKPKFADGAISFTVPPFMDFALCWIE